MRFVLKVCTQRTLKYVVDCLASIKYIETVSESILCIRKIKTKNNNLSLFADQVFSNLRLFTCQNIPKSAIIKISDIHIVPSHCNFHFPVIAVNPTKNAAIFGFPVSCQNSMTSVGKYIFVIKSKSCFTAIRNFELNQI